MEINSIQGDKLVFTIRDNQLNYIDACIPKLADAEEQAASHSRLGPWQGIVHVYRSPKLYAIGTLVSTFDNGEKV